MLLEQLLRQPVRRIDLIQPWRAAGEKGWRHRGQAAGWRHGDPLRVLLVFRSPLRFASCQTGTVIGVRSSGAPLTLGYRFDWSSEDVSTGSSPHASPGFH